MKLGHLITSGTAAAVLVFFSGCANHLEDITKEIPENTREVMARQYILTPGKNTPDSSIFKVTLEQIENIRVTTYQVRKISAICTPYEGWRESYEFLAGLGLFPIAVFSNVFSVFTFGIFPFSWSSELTKYAFDGMNPFMNFESYSRTQEIPLNVERTQIDSYTENKRNPLKNEMLVIRAGDDVWRVKTNQRGEADIVLLSADPETSQRIDSRYLDIYLEKDNKKYKTVPISRRFLSRLTQANETILRYRAAPSAKGLAECVKKLESLSFEDVALQLEERELKAHPDFRREFEQAFE